MKINRFVTWAGSVAALSLVMGTSFFSQPALAQVIVHFQESTGPAGEAQKPVDTVAAEMKLREELGMDPIPAPDPEEDRENIPGQKQPTGVVSGQVMTEDGSPVPDTIQLQIMSRRPGGGGYGTGTIARGGNFSQSVRAGRVTVMARVEGWAMAVVGPFDLKEDGAVDDISIVLTRGLSTQVKIVDPAGKPVVGAKVYAQASASDSFGNNTESTSDADGIVSLNNLADDPDIRLTIKASGFLSCYCDLEQGAAEMQTFVLAPCQPTIGVITEKETGKPIAEAELYSTNNGDPRERWSRGDNNFKPVAVTDAQGHYQLNDLESDNQTTLYVATPDGRFKIVSNVRAGRTINVAMPAPIIVSGKITGDISKLRTPGRTFMFSGKPAISFINSYYRPEYGGEYRTQYGTPVNEVDGHGEFEIKYLIPGKLELQIGNKTLKFDVDKSQTDLEIDLDSANPTTHPGDAPKTDTPKESPRVSPMQQKDGPQPATRPSSALPPNMGGEGGRANPSGPTINVSSINLSVLMPLVTQLARPIDSARKAAEKPKEITKSLTVELLPPEGVAEIHGWVRAQIYRRTSGPFIPAQWREVKEGKVQFDVPEECAVDLDFTRLPGVSGRVNQMNFTRKISSNESNNMSGASLTIDADGNRAIRVKMRAAGTLHCTITREDGQPVSGNIRLNVQNAASDYSDSRTNPLTLPVGSGETGEYLLTGLPLGTDFIVSVDGSSIGRPYSAVISPKMRLSVSQPAGELKLVIPNGKTITVQVIDEKDKPVGGVMVQLFLMGGQNRWGGSMGPQSRTDGLGRIVFRHVNMENVSSLVAVAGGADGWQRSNITISKDEDHATLRLPAGKLLKGMVIDDATGRPIIGVQLSAQLRTNDPYGGMSESAITDDLGQFEFYSLSLGDIQIYANDVELPRDQSLDVSPGQDKPLILRGRMRDGNPRLQLGDLPQSKAAE